MQRGGEMGRQGGYGDADGWIPLLVLPYALWTCYVHAIVAANASFTTLLRGVPVAAVVAALATAAWFRLRAPAGEAGPAVGTLLPPRNPPSGAGLSGWPGPRRPAAPLVLAAAAAWAGLLAAGLPYAVFWWGSLLAMGAAWTWSLRATDASGADARAEAAVVPAGRARWIVAVVALAAVLVVLFASRPAADDAFYLSIPATLLRFPDAPVLLHDTMYRLPDGPIMLPFYRLSNYDVLIAVVARATGIDHLLVAWLLVPAVAAIACVLAWAYLLRRTVPGRWPVVLPILFACVMLLGEANRAYGQFAFVRLFHGKGVLATCLVPIIAATAFDYARHGGLRHWLLLLAAEIAALGVTASALFVAPAAAALGLAGGWSPGLARSRRFVLGMLPAAYLFGAAWLVGAGTHGAQALAAPSPAAMPAMPKMLAATWGTWSTPVLLAALLSAWAFVRDPIRSRYFSAGAFFFLLAALNPYTAPLVAAVSIGVKTYWRLTWALPLPLFLAVVVDGVAVRALHAKSRALAAAACASLLALSVAFAARSGVLLCANGVTIGLPGPKAPPREFEVARTIAERVPEDGAALAPEAVATWLPLFRSHPRIIAVRQMYLGLAFPSAETAERSNLMRYVDGTNRAPGARAWFVDAIARHGITAVAYAPSVLWAAEIDAVLRAQGWRALSCNWYTVMVRGDIAPSGPEPPGCAVPPLTGAR